MAKLSISQKEYEKMLISLEKNGYDGFATLSHATATILGAAGAAACAPTLASLAGATTITGVSWFASLFGVTAVAVTPVGWFAGAAAAGGMIIYGLGYCIRKGGRHDEKRKMLAADIRRKINDLKSKASTLSEDEEFKEVIHLLRICHVQRRVDPTDGFKIIAALDSNKISAQQALLAIEYLTDAQSD